MSEVEKLYAALKQEFDLDLVIGGTIEVLIFQWQAQVVNALASRIAFLAWPIVNPVLGFIVGTVLRTALTYSELGAYFFFVDKITKAQADDFIKARIDHLEALEKGDKDAIKQTEEEAIRRAKELIKFNGLFDGTNIIK